MSPLFQLISWPTFGIALLVFGFAPGAALRVIVLAFPRSDPRRRELLAELYAVPRVERPFWVFEQLEVALFEGLCVRLAAQRAASALRAQGWTKIRDFLEFKGGRFLVTDRGVCVASRHIDVDGSYIPVRYAVARPVLEQLVSGPLFPGLPRRYRKMILNLLANGPREPWPLPRQQAVWDWARTRPCLVCGSGDCYNLELLVQERLNSPWQPAEPLWRAWQGRRGQSDRF